MKKSVYIETSIPSYLTARSSHDAGIATWQRITRQWWDKKQTDYELVTSELVIVEASAGDPEAAARRPDALQGIAELPIDEEIQKFADQLMSKGGIPAVAKADALHIAITAVHGIDYLLTWNLRHIDNPVKKPRIRSICADAGYSCPEICTPAELLQRTEF
uniref:PIN domain-containing protein n=1 Tax=Candidatus Kentrum sp. DK TaxID=2126562 RepID=A0A450SA79_9GAMM|nr:MAG: PIN domain-containing protein [Candidatus Kentron sp. DK]